MTTTNTPVPPNRAEYQTYDAWIAAAERSYIPAARAAGRTEAEIEAALCDAVMATDGTHRGPCPE